jgi:hypothetical protein
MIPLYQAFTLISASAPSEGTIQLLQMPVTRKDTGTTVRLGDFLCSVTASRIGSQGGASAIAVVCWGKESDSDIFYKIIHALKNIEGEWNPEGFGNEWKEGRSIHWVSAFSIDESSDNTYSEISPIMNREAVCGVLDAWLHHIVGPVAKDDPLSMMITAVAKSQERANEIVSAGQKLLTPILKK